MPRTHALTARPVLCLCSVFSKWGTVQSARIVTDRDTGKSRGFAHVQLDSVDSAKKAMEEVNPPSARPVQMPPLFGKGPGADRGPPLRRSCRRTARTLMAAASAWTFRTRPATPVRAPPEKRRFPFLPSRIHVAPVSADSVPAGRSGGGGAGGSRAGPVPVADEEKMKTDTVFLGRLSYDTTEDSIRALGEEFGEVVSARLAKDKDTGASKGYACSQMRTRAGTRPPQPAHTPYFGPEPPRIRTRAGP